jgi:hypothetical protein
MQAAALQPDRSIVFSARGVTKVIKFPVSSLAHDGDRWTVFLVQDGRATRRAIEVGQRNDTEAQALKGLSQVSGSSRFPATTFRKGSPSSPRRVRASAGPCGLVDMRTFGNATVRLKPGPYKWESASTALTPRTARSMCSRVL